MAGLEPAPQSISLPDDRSRKESALRIVSVTRVKCPPLCIELQRHINSPFLRWSAQERAVIFGHTRGRLISTALAFRGLRLVESKSFGGILEKKGLAVSKGEKEPKRCAAYGYRGKLPVVHGAMCPLRPTGSAGSGADGRNQTATTRCLLLVLSFHTSAYKESHLHSIGCFSGAGNAIKGNGEGRPNSSRKPSSPDEEPSSCPARFRIARVRLCHFSTASVPAATRRHTDGTPGWRKN